MNYNKVISVDDYKELVKHAPPVRRKWWEVAMTRRTLEDHGVVHGNAEILGAGAGHEATIYHLSAKVKRVFATDLYLSPGIWKGTAVQEMLTHPQRFAPSDVEYDRQRIVVQHMNMLDLAYPDDTFDGIFSSGSIEHVGTLEDVAKAAAELGRVLKPGGIMSLSTEFKISGDGGGWQGVLVLTEKELETYIIEPSGCELVDELVVEVDEDTLATAWELDDIIAGKRPDQEAVIIHKGYLFTSIHLALKKPDKPARASYSRSKQRGKSK